MIAKYFDKTITDIDEMISFAKENQLNRYNGFNDSVPFARLRNETDTVYLLIKYDSIIDCKITELKLKENCTTVIPKTYGWRGGNIRASNGLKQELNKLRANYSCYASFESVIWDLIIEHYDNL